MEIYTIKLHEALLKFNGWVFKKQKMQKNSSPIIYNSK